jgi:oligoendopeptidase F
MDYKGYNIALHELGHCVEQVFSLNKVDHTLLQGVPNTAFTEAFAFVFQKRDLDVLGLSEKDPQSEHLAALNDLWQTAEIAAVALVDMDAWHWLYEHPEATPKEFEQAVIDIAKRVWNEYYYPVIGKKDSEILAIYSHMIDSGLYLPDYPLGHLISFQIEQYIKGKNLAREMERMCVQGRISPIYWMEGAVGAKLSAEPMISAAYEALKVVQ